MLQNDEIPPKSEKSPKESILLNGESLWRHFNFVIPGITKLAAFKISDAYNTYKNKKGIKNNNPVDYHANLIEDNNSPESEENEINFALQIGEEDELSPINNFLQKPWNEICPALMLGVIPEKNTLDEVQSYVEKKYKERKYIKIIVPMNEFELVMKGKIQPTYYEKMNDMINDIYPEPNYTKPIHHHLIPMTDFGGGGITKESLLSGVYEMRQTIMDGACIYAHCKAGRARSAVIVAAYLAIYPPEDSHIKQYDLHSAVNYLLSKRSQVDLHSELVKDDQWKDLHLRGIKGIGKLERASEAIVYHQTLMAQQQKFYDTVLNRNQTPDIQLCDKIALEIKNDIPIHAFNENSKQGNDECLHGTSPLSTLEFKNHLIQMTSFKHLKSIAAHAKGKRAAYTQELCQQIFDATDDGWFDQRHLNANNPIIKLWHHNDITKEHRETIDDFIKGIKSYQLEQNQHQEMIAIKNNDNVKTLSNYVNYLHSLSFTARLGKKRSLEKSWEKAKHQLLAVENNPNKVNKESACAALDTLAIKLKNRTEESKDNTLNFNPDFDKIQNLKNDIMQREPRPTITFFYSKTTAKVPVEKAEENKSGTNIQPTYTNM